MNSQPNTTVRDGGSAFPPLVVENGRDRRISIGLRSAVQGSRNGNFEGTGYSYWLSRRKPQGEVFEHCRRTARFALLLGRTLGFSWEALHSLGRAAVVHDIGKLLIAPETLTANRLSAEQWITIRRHPADGRKLLLLNGYPVQTANIVLCHHERYDGNGYPNRLAGERIPLEARALAVADSFDAITSPRPYKPALSITAAQEEIARVAGSQLDPVMVNYFLRIRRCDLTKAVQPWM